MEITFIYAQFLLFILWFKKKDSPPQKKWITNIFAEMNLDFLHYGTWVHKWFTKCRCNKRPQVCDDRPYYSVVNDLARHAC